MLKDKKHFESYSDKWRKEKSISGMWRDTAAVFFPLFYQDGVIIQTRKLLPNHFDVFQRLAEKIVTPYVLQDFFLMIMNGDDGWDTVLRILEEASAANLGDGLFEDEIKSIVAPVALNVLVEHILSDNSKINGELTDSELYQTSEPLTRINQLAGVLKGRSDGFYLAYHYLKYLLWRELKVDSFYELLDVLQNTFYDDANRRFVRDDRIIVEGLDNISASDVSAFETTGILTSSFKDDLLINFRTVIRLISLDEHAEKAFNTFKVMYSCDVPGFLTIDMKFQLKHYDIALLLLSQDDTISAWKEIQALMRAGRHRLSNKYFGEQSNNLRYHIEFMWSVNLRMLDYLCREDKEAANIVWKEVWKDGLEYSHRFSRFCDDVLYSYLSSLICYYYAGDINDARKAGIEGVMPHFKDIDNLPILVLMAARLLMNNGIRWDDLMNGEYAGFFEEVFKKAAVWSKERKQYEWVRQYFDVKGKLIDFKT